MSYLLTCTVYIAAVWNTYRKTHLMVLDIIVRCTKRLLGDDLSPPERIRAEELAEDIASSIPYHLIMDPDINLKDLDSNLRSLKMGSPVGGLLLLHPLYVVTRSETISAQLRVHMCKCLAWIGKHMGIGQATLLSDVSASNLMIAVLLRHP